VTKSALLSLLKSADAATNGPEPVAYVVKLGKIIWQIFAKID
jgi:hypothetical protein